MRRPIVRGRRPAEGRWPPGPRDTLLASYPRSGNTWVRFLLAGALHPSISIDFRAIADLIPDIHEKTLRELRRRKPPVVAKTHEPHRPAYRRAVYLVRDPRDVAVSYRHYLIKTRGLDLDAPLDGFLDRLLAGEVQFGRWDSHATGWMNGCRDVLLLRYEDVRGDPLTHLREVLRFLNVDRSDDELVAAVRGADIERMRHLERTKRDDIEQLRGTRDTTMFVRQGRSGGWREELTAPQADRIWAAVGDVAAMVGYRH